MRIRPNKDLGRSLVRPLNNRRGVALLMATAAIMLISYLALELSYDSNIEYEVNAKSLNRLKAYYAAKSGMKLSLLRIKVYQQAQEKFGQQLGSNSELLNQIWKFPFAWPLPVPDELNAVDKDTFQKMTQESIMDAAYMVTIEDEGSKIDINDLASPSKSLRESTFNQLLSVFQQKLREDEAFGRKYANFRFDELINSISDWMSAKAQSANGGDKRAAYQRHNSESQSNYYPPNRPFRTLAELHMVPGMDDELYQLLEPRITIYGMKGINPNFASREMLISLDPGMTEEAVNEVVKRRDNADEGGPFKSEDEFWNFVQSHGAQLESNPRPPLTFDAVMNFKIRSTGEFAGAAREIVAIVMDLDRTAKKVKSILDQEKQDANGNSGQPQMNNGKSPTGQPPTQMKSSSAKGPPRIVYWNER